MSRVELDLRSSAAVHSGVVLAFIGRLGWLVLVLGAAAYGQSGWRFWAAADGLAESYTRTLAVAPGGTVWVRHGQIGKMSILNGYGVERIPEPRAARAVDWTLQARVHGGPTGGAWTVEDGVLKRYADGRWTALEPPPWRERMLAAIPVGETRVWVLFRERLAEFRTDTRSWTAFKESAKTCVGAFSTMVLGLNSDLWITGEHGAGRLEVHRDGEGYRWTECDTRRIGLRSIRKPVAGEAGDLHFLGSRTGSENPVAARWQASHLEIVATSPHLVQAWRGFEDSVWVLERSSVRQTIKGVPHRIDRRGPLAGSVFEVVAQPKGVFWLATSEGVARYAPPLWRSPSTVHHLEEAVYSIIEDRQGHLWFAGTQNLIEFDGGAWRLHPLPPGYRLHSGPTEYLSEMPDGRITVKSFNSVGRHSLLLFDPRTRKFSEVRHPDLRTIFMAWRRDDASLWVATRAKGSSCQLEIFDGKNFTPRIDLGRDAGCDDLRTVVETSDRAVWVGSTAGAGRIYRDGKLEKFGTRQGYQEAAVFAMIERSPGRVLVAGRDAMGEFDGRKWSVWRRGLDRPRSILRARDGALWVASANGIHRYREGTWIAHAEHEGLPSEIAYKVFQDRRGRIWAGTSRGLALYHPDADIDPPETHFAADANSAEVSPDGNAKISYVGVDKWNYTATERLLYSSRVDRGEWSPFSSASIASFRALRPGPHAIEVRAMDRNGNVGPPSVPFEIKVLLPWYRHAGFLAILGASLAAILVLLRLAVRQYQALRRAKVAAETANRCKSEFLANMSHEIRTPMNAIMGMTALAAEIADNPDQIESLNEVLKSSESLLSLLNDILDLSKVEAGKVELAPVDFSLAECVAGVLGTLRMRADEKGLELRNYIEPGLPPFLLGDEQRLRQVLVNLAGNAVKFTETGRITMRVCGVQEKSDGLWTLKFVVADTGIGIPHEKQGLVFAPFQQADGSITRIYGGTGLGLAISSRLVQLMKGSIWVESPWRDSDTDQLVTGSAFHFTARFATGTQPVVTAPMTTDGTVAPLRILVAEDNPVNQKVASRMLEKMGHHVVIAANGVEALAVFDEQPLDVVFMDVQMPRMDGLEATAAIRVRERALGRHIPIIGLTAHALVGDRERCLKAGMDAYLSKPMRREDLLHVLAETTSPSHRQ